MLVSNKFLYGPEFKAKVEGCKTPLQVKKLLEHYGINIKRDDSDEVGCFSIWINDAIRIYQNYRKEMILQKWQKVNMTYSGTPTYPSAQK